MGKKAAQLNGPSRTAGRLHSSGSSLGPQDAPLCVETTMYNITRTQREKNANKNAMANATLYVLSIFQHSLPLECMVLKNVSTSIITVNTKQPAPFLKMTP